MKSYKINKSDFYYLLGVISYIVFLYIRNPEILKFGRFFAEEGSIFWSYSLAHNFFETLLFVDIMTGYYSFNTNIQIALTKLFDIKYGPLLTTWTSLLISILPSFLYYKLNHNKIENSKRILVSFILLTLPSLNFLEIFANSINSKTFLGVSTFIILIYGLEAKNNKFFENLILFVAFLSSYYSLIMLPAFLLKYFVEKNSNILTSISIGAFAGFIQLNVLVFSINNRFLYEDKFQNKESFIYLLEIIKRSVSINFFGERFFTYNIFELISVCMFILFVCFLIYKNYFSFKRYYLVISCFLLQLFLLNFGQIGNNFNQRYAVVISTIAFFSVIRYFEEVKVKKWVLLVYLLISISFFSFQQSTYFIDCSEFCYSWFQQIEDARNNNIVSYTHWPLGEGEAYWTTNVNNPKINPSPFQKEILGDDYFKLANITMLDIVKSNFAFYFK